MRAALVSPGTSVGRSSVQVRLGEPPRLGQNERLYAVIMPVGATDAPGDGPGCVVAAYPGDVQHLRSGRVVCSVVGAFVLAGCAGSASRPGVAARPRVTAPTVTETTTAGANPSNRTVSIDLSGTAGVTSAEQHRAEKLVEDTIADLRRYESPAEAYAAGYRSIGDGITGDEHYVNWSYVNDGHILDPARPESIVYEYRSGAQRAVAAMYMLPFGSTFADVPDVGGPLTQWHVHRNLCLTNNPQQKIVAGLTSVDGGCPPGTSKAGDTPMLHVWTVPNACGPFAALEGIGAGQVPAGQTRLCDTTHASVP
jgi:hypothetical protein